MVHHALYNSLTMNEPTPPSSVSRLQQIRDERIARAAAKRTQFEIEQSRLVVAKDHDHSYCMHSDSPSTHHEVDTVLPPQKHLIRKLYVTRSWKTYLLGTSKFK